MNIVLKRVTILLQLLVALYFIGVLGFDFPHAFGESSILTRPFVLWPFVAIVLVLSIFQVVDKKTKKKS